MAFADQFRGINEKTDFNARGFTPFQFSSRKTQMNTTQLGGLIPTNPISDLFNESMSWYEMWINPSRISLSRNFQQSKHHTAGAIVTYHFRPETIDMQVSGSVGWIARLPQEEYPGILSSSFRRTSPDPAKNNSPRVFLKRLRTMAEEPMYFVDLKGIEHYNTKYIKIYTKQYPNGMVCEGYYTKFDVPESGDDAQTVDYSFNFVVEIMNPITALQRMAGMFGGGARGGTLRSIPGLQ